MRAVVYWICFAFCIVWTLEWLTGDLPSKYWDVITNGALIKLNGINFESPADVERFYTQIQTMIGVAFWTGVWFFPVVGVGIIGILAKPSSKINSENTIKPKSNHSPLGLSKIIEPIAEQATENDNLTHSNVK